LSPTNSDGTGRKALHLAEWLAEQLTNYFFLFTLSKKNLEENMHLAPISGISKFITYGLSCVRKHPIISVAIAIITTYGIYNYQQNVRIAREREARIQKNREESRLRDAERRFNERLQKLEKKEIKDLKENLEFIAEVFDKAKTDQNKMDYSDLSSEAFNIPTGNNEEKIQHIEKSNEVYINFIIEIKDTKAPELINLRKVLETLIIKTPESLD
jgi:hypothetical protein